MKRFKKILCLLVALVPVMLTITGCHTIHGAGEDIEQGGEEIQEAAH